MFSFLPHEHYCRRSCSTDILLLLALLYLSSVSHLQCSPLVATMSPICNRCVGIIAVNTVATIVVYVGQRLPQMCCSRASRVSCSTVVRARFSVVLNVFISLDLTSRRWLLFSVKLKESCFYYCIKSCVKWLSYQFSKEFSSVQI